MCAVTFAQLMSVVALWLNFSLFEHFPFVRKFYCKNATFGAENVLLWENCEHLLSFLLENLQLSVRKLHRPASSICLF